MTNISIELSGPDFTTYFHNDWDVCESQGLLHVESLEGWYGGVGASSSEMTLAGQHGTYRTPTLRGSRSMTLVLTWVSSVDPSRSAYTQFSRFASGLAWDKGPYRLTVTEGDIVLSTDVQLDGEVQHQAVGGVEDAFRVMVPLKADSFLYGPDRVTYLTPEGAGVGMEYDLFSKDSGDGEPIITDGTIHRELNTSSGATTFDLFGTGPIGAGGSSKVTISDEWSASGGTSLKVSAGKTRSSAAYIIPRRTALGEWAGKLVTITGTIHVPAVMTDEDVTSPSNPPRAICISGEWADPEQAPLWSYASSVSAPNAPGTYTLTVSCILPENQERWQGWFVRLFNGSQSVPVYWDNVTVEARELPKADPHTSLSLYVDPLRIAQSFTIDSEADEYYVGQPAPGSSVDGYLRRMDNEGQEIESRFFEGIGHLNHLSFERDEDDVWVWFWHNGLGKLARYGWGTDTLESFQLPFDQAAYASIHGGTVALHRTGGNYSNSYELHALADIKAETASTPTKVISDVVTRGHAVQGHAHDDTYLYVHRGGSRGDAIGLWRYAWAGGDPVAISTSGYGLDGLSPNCEAEGIAIRETTGDIVFGIAAGPTYDRIASVHDVDPAKFDETVVHIVYPGPVLSYGEYVDIDELVQNLGNATAYPSLLVVGDFPGGIGISAGRGTLEFPWPITRQAPLQIDSSGSAWIGAANVTARLSKRDFTAFQLRPGARIAPAMYALQGGSGYCEMHVRDAYI